MPPVDDALRPGVESAPMSDPPSSPSPAERKPAPGPFRAVWRIVRTVGLAYLAVLVVVYFFQRRLQYFPSPGPVALPSGAMYEGLEEFTATASDGVRLRGWYWPGTRPIVLLIFNGNGGHRGHRLDWMADLRSLGVGVCAVDYRGYGGSQGVPTEEGLYRDAEAALDWLEGRGLEKVVYLGESLGSAVAVELARRRPPAALIVQSGFSSAVDVGQKAYPFLPVRLLMKDRYESAAKIAQVRAPSLFIHGTKDSIVPIRFGRALHDAATGVKEWYEVPNADHNDLPWVGGRAYLERIRRFLQEHVER